MATANLTSQLIDPSLVHPSLIGPYFSTVIPSFNYVLDDLTDGNLTDNNYTGGTALDDIVFGDDGINTLAGLGGDDILVGGSNINTFQGGTGNDELDGSLGILDTVEETGVFNSMILSNSQLVVDDGINVYTDTLLGIEQAELISDFTGNVTIDASAFSGFTLIRATQTATGTINALLSGSGGSNIVGGDGDDDIQGSDGVDILYGGAGEDTLQGGGQDDMLFGGDDNDSLQGGNRHDTLYGEDGDDILRGGNGEDTLYGGENADTLRGGNGDDILNGGNGIDRVLASGDFDFELSDTMLEITKSSGLETDTLVDIETATLTGGDSANVINAAAFTLGATILEGEGGNDTITGSAQDDVITGGFGTDVLTSGGAFDDDIFLFNSAGEGLDIINDFDAVGGLFFNNQDMIQVSASGFAPTGGAAALSVGILPAAQLADDVAVLGAIASFRYNETTGLLSFDSDGGTAATGVTDIASLSNTPTLAAMAGNIEVI